MFGFVYEDSEIEINSIEKYLKNNKINSGLMILSGGCTMFNIAPYFDELTAIDTNDEQINLVNKKIELIKKNDKDVYQKYLESIDMNFDIMFKKIKNGSNIKDVFDKDNLIKNFGINAVKNTSHNFAEHFQTVYNSKSKYHDFIFNRNFDYKLRNYDNYVSNIKKIEKVNLIKNDMYTFLKNSDKKYDFIQTSNITDWIQKENFIDLCHLLKEKLNDNGVLIMRRMLSDNILETEFCDCIHLTDNTNIYSECILWIKH